MATGKNIRFQSYCDEVYSELSGMKKRCLEFVKEIEGMKGSDKEMLNSHISHFNDIVKTIEWKLEILTKVCPSDWTGHSGVERTASVHLSESDEREAVSPGYIGG